MARLHIDKGIYMSIKSNSVAFRETEPEVAEKVFSVFLLIIVLLYFLFLIFAIVSLIYVCLSEGISEGIYSKIFILIFVSLQILLIRIPIKIIQFLFSSILSHYACIFIVRNEYYFSTRRNNSKNKSLLFDGEITIEPVFNHGDSGFTVYLTHPVDFWGLSFRRKSYLIHPIILGEDEEVVALASKVESVLKEKFPRLMINNLCTFKRLMALV